MHVTETLTGDVEHLNGSQSVGELNRGLSFYTILSVSPLNIKRFLLVCRNFFAFALVLHFYA